jgi:hypothetical protein
MVDICRERSKANRSKAATRRQFLKGPVWVFCALAWLIALGSDAPLIRGYFRASGFRLTSDLTCFRDNGAWLGRHLAAAAQGAAAACTFKYPPPFLFVAAPLSWLKPEQDFAAWSVVSIAILGVAARTIGISWRPMLAGMLAPSTMLCLSIGESGIIVSSLLLLALGLAETAPIAAGIAAGAIVIKPTFGLLLPVCYAASRNLKAVLAAAITAIGLCVLSVIAFGPGVWGHYLHEGLPAAHATLGAPWPQRDQHIMITPYIFVHSLGAGYGLANAVQCACSLLAAMTTWVLWRSPSFPARLPLTLCLAALAVPFACLYDLPALAFAVAAQGGAAFAWFWIFSGLDLVISIFFLPLGAPCLAFLLWMLWRVSGRQVIAVPRIFRGLPARPTSAAASPHKTPDAGSPRWSPP